MESIYINKNEIEAVIYHDKCLDGFFSAFTIWYFYKSRYGIQRANAVKYISHNSVDINDVLGKNIVVCDFPSGNDNFHKVINLSKTYLIINRNEVTYKDTEKTPTKLNTDGKYSSVCVATWDFFFPNIKPPSFLIRIRNDENSIIKDYLLIYLNELYSSSPQHNFEKWEEYFDDENIAKASLIGEKWLEYQKIIVETMIKRTYHAIHEINDDPVIISYCTSQVLKINLGLKILEKFPMSDIVCICDHNFLENKTYYHIFSTDDRYDISRLLSSDIIKGHGKISETSLDGIHTYLPHKLINNNTMIKAIMNATTGTVGAKRKISYVHLNVNDVDGYDVEIGLKLVKRKYANNDLIILEKGTDMITIKNMEVKTLKEYNVLFNEKTLNTENQLLFTTCGIVDKVITFTSEKDLSEILEKILEHQTEFMVSTHSHNVENCNS